METIDTESGAEACDAFLDAFETLAQAIRRARGAAPQDRDLLSFSQLTLLLPLAAGDTARVSDLATRAGISASTATRILDALERRRIVKRVRPEHDRRTVTVALTARGREVLQRQDAWTRALKGDFYAGLDPAQRTTVCGLLASLAELVDALAAGPAGD
jgi:DNA-binding MarR family transcriptional regulator